MGVPLHHVCHNVCIQDNSREYLSETPWAGDLRASPSWLPEAKSAARERYADRLRTLREACDGKVAADGKQKYNSGFWHSSRMYNFNACVPNKVS